MARSRGNAICGNLRWSKQDEATFVEMMSDNKSYAQIGRALGRTEKAVEQHAYTIRQQLRKKGEDPSSFLKNSDRPLHNIKKVKGKPAVKNYESNNDRTVELLAYTAVFTGGCFLTLVVMTVLLIAIS